MNKQCNQCDYEWIANTQHPKACPRCKRYDWDKIKDEKGGNETSSPSSFQSKRGKK